MREMIHADKCNWFAVGVEGFFFSIKGQLVTISRLDCMVFLHLLISAREMWNQTGHLGLCSHRQYEAPWQDLCCELLCSCLLGRPV